MTNIYTDLCSLEAKLQMLEQRVEELAAQLKRFIAEGKV